MILLIIFALSVVFWFFRKRALSCLFLYISIENCFQLKFLSTDYDVTYLSFAWATYAVFAYLREKKTNLFHLSLENCVVWLYLYMWLHAYCTIMLEIETIQYSFVVLRQWGGVGLILLARKLTKDEISVLFKYLFGVTLVVGALYYLQFAGFDLFVEERFKTIYKRNSPHLYVFFSIYVYFLYRNFQQWLFMLPLLFMSVTSGVRNSLAAVIAALVFYSAVINKSKKIFVLGIIVLFAYHYTSELLLDDVFNRNGNLSFQDEIKEAFSLDYKHFYGFETMGTLSYRVLYFAERVDYLLNHPLNMPFGIGSIYEASPNNHMNFYIQSSGRIATDDLFWATPLLMYGFFCIALYIIFIYKAFLFFKKHIETDLFASIGLVFLLFLLFSSMTTWSFHAEYNLFVLGLLVSIVQKKNDGLLLEKHT